MHWIGFVIAVILGLYLVLRWIKSLRVDKFDEKYVFVTGCDTGFGHHLVIKLDRMGFNVFAGCLTTNGRTGLEKECSRRLKTLSLDVTQRESIKKAVEFVKDNLPAEKGIWAVVNNAGVLGTMVASEMLDRSEFDSTMDVNLFGPIEINKAFLPLVRKTKGRLVTMTSIVGRYPLFGAPYCVSKAALEAYLDVLRKEIYNQGINVSMIEPGGVNTNLMDTMKDRMEKTFSQVSDELKAVYGQDYVRGRLEGTGFIKSLPSTIGHVVDAYVRAITERYTQTRYVVGMDAKFFFLPLSFLPDSFGDWLISWFESFTVKVGEINCRKEALQAES